MCLYYIITREMSNGLEYVIKTEVMDEENGRKAFNSEIGYLASTYPDEKPIQTTDKNIYAQSEENMKGKGHSVQIISENHIVAEIMKAVDESAYTTKWEHIGENHYVLDAKTIEINLRQNDDVEITRIIRRPYDTENPSDYDYIYDVHGIYNGAEYINTLDEVDEDILLAIYLEIIDNAN